MRVLFVHPNDVGVSGGTIAMHRLRNGLRDAGHPSQILCVARQLPAEESVLIPAPALVRAGESLLRPLTIRAGFNDLHRLGSFLVPGLPAYQAADVIDLHCMHGAYFNFLSLPRLTRRKPAVITLHDMWPVTGHCAFSLDCGKYATGCGDCPYPDTFPAVWRDNTHAEWTMKRWAYRRSAVAAVAPSLWLARAAMAGPFRGLPVYHIPYGVNTTTYRPAAADRDAVGLPKDRLLILAAAASISRDTRDRKGGDLLMAALAALPEELRRRSTLVVMGRADETFLRAAPLEAIALGYVREDAKKAAIYAAVDCMVCSTRADNLPLVILESLASGTPVAAFGVGGVGEAVREGITGALAAPEDSQSLARAIERVLTHPAADEMRRSCRSVAEAEYDIALQVHRTVSLYGSLVAQLGARGRLDPHVAVPAGQA